MSLALLALSTLRAMPAAAEPYVVVLIEPEEAELVTRVEGQTRDLGVSVEVLENDSAERSAAAEARLAMRSGADFLARIERTADGTLEVRVYDAKLRTLRTRVVPAPARRDRLASSAELEAAALVLRSEVSALIDAREAAAQRGDARPERASGGVPDTAAPVTRVEVTPPPPPPAPEPPPPASKPSPPRPRPPPPPPPKPVVEEERDNDNDEDQANDEDNDNDEDEETEDDEAEEPDEPEVPSPPLENYSARSRTWTIRGGLRGSLPVESSALLGAFAGGRMQFGWFEVGFTLSTSLPIELGDDTVRIHIRRHGLTAEALGVIPWGPRLRALFGVEAGAVLYSRSTERVAPGYNAADSELYGSLSLGAQAELQWLFARNWGVAASAGFTYVPQPTRFAYTTPDERAVGELQSVEPLMCVSLFGLFGP